MAFTPESQKKRYSDYISENIVDPNNPSFKLFELRLNDLMQQAKVDGLNNEELKCLVRHNAIQYIPHNGAFSAGPYMHYFQEVYTPANSNYENEPYNEFLVTLDKLCSIDYADTDFEVLYPYIKKLWDELLSQISPERDRASASILWNVVKPIINGQLNVRKLKLEQKILYFTQFSELNGDSDAKEKKARSEIAKQLKSDIDNLIIKEPKLKKEVRAVLINFYITLLDAARPLSFMEKDYIAKYFTKIDEFIDHLIKNVLRGQQQYEQIVQYLTEFKKDFLPGLQQYCEDMRFAKSTNPFVADLLVEAYLLKRQYLDHIQEPHLLLLLEPWENLQNTLIKQTNYQGKPFSFRGKRQKSSLDHTILVFQERQDLQPLATDPHISDKLLQTVQAIRKLDEDEQKNIIDDLDGIMNLPTNLRAEKLNDYLRNLPQEEQIIGKKHMEKIVKKTIDEMLINGNLIDYFIKISGIEKYFTEKYLQDKLKEKIEGLQGELTEGKINLESQDGIEKFNAEISELKKYLVSASIRKAFLSSWILLYHKMKNRYENSYNLIIKVLNEIAETITLPQNLTYEVKFEDQQESINMGEYEAKIPPLTGENGLDSFKSLPDLDNFSVLQSYLQKHEEFKNELESLHTFINKWIKSFDFINFRYFYEIKESIYASKDKQLSYINHCKKLHKEAMSFCTKLRTLKIRIIDSKRYWKKKLIKDTDSYFDELEKIINNYWNHCVLSSLVLYGKYEFEESSEEKNS